jgi:hypothetical protein
VRPTTSSRASRSSDRLDRTRFLDGTEALEHPARGHELDFGGSELLVPRIREVVGLEGDGRLRELGEDTRNPRSEFPVDDDGLDTLHAAGRLRIAPIREQQDLLVSHQHKSVRALEAREVTDVDRV